MADGLLPDDRPVARQYTPHVAFGRLDRGAVHQVDVVVAGGGVAPQDIALAVAVVVAHRHDLPVEIRDRAYVALARLDRGAVHRVEVVLAAARVAPHDVSLAVAIEIAHAFDLPAGNRDR